MLSQIRIYQYEANEGWELHKLDNRDAFAEDGALFVPKEDYDALFKEYEALRMGQLTAYLGEMHGASTVPILGFCKRCGAQFEQKTKKPKNYCSRKCINAVNTANWRRSKKALPPNSELIAHSA